MLTFLSIYLGKFPLQLKRPGFPQTSSKRILRSNTPVRKFWLFMNNIWPIGSKVTHPTYQYQVQQVSKTKFLFRIFSFYLISFVLHNYICINNSISWITKEYKNLGCNLIFATVSHLYFVASYFSFIALLSDKRQFWQMALLHFYVNC